MDPNSLRINTPPRFQLPANVHTELTSNEVIHSFCNVLLESWIQPTTREYSYQILSLDNFNRMFYKIWNVILKHNHPPRKVYTFTLAFESEALIVLKYLAGYRVERFVLFTQALIDFLADLYIKSSTEQRLKNASPLLVKIKRTSLGPQIVKTVENNISNLYGITFGPSVQQLVQCYLLPEIQKPCTLLGHALAINARKENVSINSDNLLFSRFVRTKDKNDDCDDRFAKVNDNLVVRIKKTVTKNVVPKKRILPLKIVGLNSASKVQCVPSRPINEKRAPSPKEADIPSCIQKEQTLPRWGQSCYQESANLGPQTELFADNTDVQTIHSDSNEVAPYIDSNRINCKEMCVASEIENEKETSNPIYSYKPAKLVQLNACISNNSNEENEVSDALNICCGLDSRYCNCYSLEGYVPKILYYEIVIIRMIPMDIGAWRILMAKYSYDRSFEDIYKTGDLNPVEQLKRSKLKTICLLDDWKKHGDKILNEKFVMTVPSNLYREWGNQKKISIDTRNMFLTMVPVKNNSLLSTLNVLSPVQADFQEKEFLKILEHSFAYFEDEECGVNGARLKTDTRAERLVDSSNSECNSSPKPVNSILNQSGIFTEVQRNEEIQTATENPPIKKMVSIGIQAVIPNIPFSIICLAEIRSNIESYPPITGEFLFQHGFETCLNADYQTRIQHIKTGWKLDTSRYEINILNDLSVCMLCKDESNEQRTAITQGLDINYIHQVDKLFTDTLEWEKEAVRGVALPFYFKKLKPAFISTENDFPSTLVAKKKINNLIFDAYSVFKLNMSKTVPVLWISTKNLELSMIRHRVTSGHIFPLFKKSSNAKYSIDTIYLPESITSKMIYNTKYGTFDTLPMELQQTSRVLIKLTEYPRPFLLIISDAYVFNTKLTQQCQALLHYENNIKQPEASSDVNIQSNCRGRSRKSAKKPPNFYNETSSRRDFGIDVFGASSECDKTTKQLTTRNQSPKELIMRNQPKELITANQSKGNECFNDKSVPEVTINTKITTNNCLEKNESDSSPMLRVVTNEITTTHNSLEAGKSINFQEQQMEDNGNSNNKRTTRVGFSLPLQKRYAIGQELNREKRRQTDEMFIKSDRRRLREKFESKQQLNCRMIISRVNGKTMVKQIKKKTFENKDSNINESATLANDIDRLNKVDKNLIVERWRENGVGIQNNNLPLPNRNTKVIRSYNGKKIVISPASRESLQFKKPSQDFENDSSRNPLVYGDLMTPVRIEEDIVEFDLEKAKANLCKIIQPSINIESCLNGQSLVQQQEQFAQTMEDNNFEMAHCTNDDMEIGTELEVETLRSFPEGEDNEENECGRDQPNGELISAKDGDDCGPVNCTEDSRLIGTGSQVEIRNNSLDGTIQEMDVGEHIVLYIESISSDVPFTPDESHLLLQSTNEPLDQSTQHLFIESVHDPAAVCTLKPMDQNNSCQLVIDNEKCQAKANTIIEIPPAETTSSLRDETIPQLVAENTPEAANAHASPTIDQVANTILEIPPAETTSSLRDETIPQLVAENTPEAANAHASPTTDQVALQSPEPVQIDRNTTSLKEHDVQSMTLQELFIAYPKTSISNIRDDYAFDAEHNYICKKVLWEKLKKFKRGGQDKLNNKTNTSSDADISVDKQVNLNSSNDDSLNINSPTPCNESIPSKAFIVNDIAMSESSVCKDVPNSEIRETTNSNGISKNTITESSEQNIPIKRPRIRVSSLGKINNMLSLRMQQRYVDDKNNAVALDLSLPCTKISDHSKVMPANNKNNKRKARAPCKIQKLDIMKQVQSESSHLFGREKETISKNNSRLLDSVVGNENFGSLPMNEVPLHVPRSNNHLEKTGDYSSIVSSDNFQYMSGLDDMVVFSARPPQSTTPDRPNVEKVDDSGIGVSESSRYRHPMSRNIHHISLVPTVPNVLHVRESNRMMYPESALTRHIGEESQMIPANHSQTCYQSRSYLPPNHPPTNHPPTNHPPTNHPLTNHPPTNHPPINHLPINHPPTNHPPTRHPPTTHPPTTHPPTNHPPINHPPTNHPPTNLPPHLQSMGGMNRFPSESESSLISRYNDLLQKANMCPLNYQPPSYVSSLNNNQPRPMMPRDAPNLSLFSLSHIAPLSHQSQPIESRLIHHPPPLYSDRETNISSVFWRPPRAEAHYYQRQVLEPAVSLNSRVQMQPMGTPNTARPPTNIEHHQHITSGVVNSHSELNPHYRYMIPPPYFCIDKNLNDR